MSDIKIQYYKTVLGELIIGSYKDKLCLCDWKYRKQRNKIDQRIKEYLKADFILEKTDILYQTIKQLDEYLKKERKEFDLPILLCGTDFQKTVWEELLKIPFGKTETYLGLSKKLDNEKAIRAIASANGANAIAIIIPCHRVIGSNGELVGFAGGLNAKNKLLQLESNSYQSELDF